MTPEQMTALMEHLKDGASRANRDIPWQREIGESFDAAVAALESLAEARQQAEQQIATLASELAAIANIVGEPYALDGLPLVERVVLLRKQLDADKQRCETWRNEVATLIAERDEAQRLADIYGDGIAEWRPIVVDAAAAIREARAETWEQAEQLAELHVAHGQRESLIAAYRERAAAAREGREP